MLYFDLQTIDDVITLLGCLIYLDYLVLLSFPFFAIPVVIITMNKITEIINYHVVHRGWLPTPSLIIAVYNSVLQWTAAVCNHRKRVKCTVHSLTRCRSAHIGYRQVIVLCYNCRVISSQCRASGTAVLINTAVPLAALLLHIERVSIRHALVPWFAASMLLMLYRLSSDRRSQLADCLLALRSASINNSAIH